MLQFVCVLVVAVVGVGINRCGQGDGVALLFYFILFHSRVFCFSLLFLLTFLFFFLVFIPRVGVVGDGVARVRCFCCVLVYYYYYYFSLLFLLFVIIVLIVAVVALVFLFVLFFGITAQSLQDESWNMDRIPEIMDGKNVADYVDDDIDAKLALLEKEEEQLQVPYPCPFECQIGCKIRALFSFFCRMIKKTLLLNCATHVLSQHTKREKTRQKDRRLIKLRICSTNQDYWGIGSFIISSVERKRSALKSNDNMKLLGKKKWKRMIHPKKKAGTAIFRKKYQQDKDTPPPRPPAWMALRYDRRGDKPAFSPHTHASGIQCT